MVDSLLTFSLTSSSGASYEEGSDGYESMTRWSAKDVSAVEAGMAAEVTC